MLLKNNEFELKFLKYVF